MKYTTIATFIAVSLTAGAAWAADPPKDSEKPQAAVPVDSTLGQRTRSSVASEDADAIAGKPTSKKTLSRSEKRAAKKAATPKGAKEGFVARHLDLSGDKTTNPSPTLTDTKNSVTGNPGAQ